MPSPPAAAVGPPIFRPNSEICDAAALVVCDQNPSAFLVANNCDFSSEFVVLPDGEAVLMLWELLDMHRELVDELLLFIPNTVKKRTREKQINGQL